MARHNDIGAIGEDVATKYLQRHGYTIIERNYRKKWGEIDIICRDPDGVVHFVEVKSTARELKDGVDEWLPEEMVHRQKVQRLRRVIETYLIGHDIDEWVFDVLIVSLNMRQRIGHCKIISDIVL